MKEPFPSLAALQAAHAELSRRFRDEAPLSAESLDAINAFIARGRASGTILADDNDRYAAQSLLDYWATTLYRSSQAALDTTLAPFEEAAVTELQDEAYPYQTSPFDPGEAPSARELRRAVEDPARAIGLVFEEGVVEGLLREVRDEAAAWPLLELMLRDLWRERRRNRITLEAYRGLGGVGEVLSHQAETVYQSLNQADQETARKLLLKLVRLDAWQQPTGHAAPTETLLAALSQPGAPRERSQHVVEKWVRAGLLAETGNPPRLELVHAALLRAWPRLSAWLNDGSTRERLTLTAAAEQWEATGKADGALWWGALLDKALSHQDLDGLEREFVEVSRARREQRNGRRLLLLSVGFVLVFVLAVTAFVGWRNAERLRGFAERQSNIVTAFLDKRLDAALLLAVDTYSNVDEAVAQRGLLSALRYTQQAYAPFFPIRYLRDHQTIAAQLAFSADGGKVAASGLDVDAPYNLTVWDTASGEVEPGSAFEPAPPGLRLEGAAFLVAEPAPLWQRLNDVRTNFFAKDAESNVTSAALSPDAQTLALGYDDGTVILWGVQGSDQPLLGQALPGLGESAAIQRSAFGEGGRLLASSTGQGAISLREVESGRRLPDISTGGRIRSLALSPDGRRLAWLEAANQPVLWDISAGKEADSTFSDPLETAILSLAFSPEGELLLGRQGGAVTVWDAEADRVRHETLAGFEGSILDLSLSSKGALAVTDSQRFASLWRLESGQSIVNPLPVTDLVTALAFSPEGEKLALGTRSGAIILWNVNRREVIGELERGEGAEILSLAFLEGGDRLVSSSSDGKIMLWDIGVDLLIEQACRIANPASGKGAETQDPDALSGVGCGGE